jgi:hypothetical protein
MRNVERTCRRCTHSLAQQRPAPRRSGRRDQAASRALPERATRCFAPRKAKCASGGGRGFALFFGVMGVCLPSARRAARTQNQPTRQRARRSIPLARWPWRGGDRHQTLVEVARGLVALRLVCGRCCNKHAEPPVANTLRSSTNYARAAPRCLLPRWHPPADKLSQGRTRVGARAAAAARPPPTPTTTIPVLPRAPGLAGLVAGVPHQRGRQLPTHSPLAPPPLPAGAHGAA